MGRVGTARVNLALVAVVLLGPSAQSAEGPEDSSNEGVCPSRLHGPADVLRCALANHPYLVRERSRLKQGERLLDIASQVPNPELEARLEHMDSSGTSSISADVTLLQPFELGGKRDARGLKARAEKMTLASDAVAVQDQVALDTVLDLYRLRQLQEEDDQIKEALKTFERVSRQYRARGHLSPEQEVSLTVFRMAASDYRIRENLLEAEVHERRRSLEFATGRPFEVQAKLLPSDRTRWPELKESNDGAQATEMLRAKAALALAGADVELAQAGGWPDLKLGPAFSNSGSGVNHQRTLGVMLNVPLPLFNVNGGQKAYSRVGVEMAARHYEAVQGRVVRERANFLERYRKAVASLANAAIDPHKEHAKVESYMERGIVPSGLVVESHRQFLEFLRSRHQQELAALEALWRVYAIDGQTESNKFLEEGAVGPVEKGR